MDEIAQYERRITAALDRIAGGIDALAAARAAAEAAAAEAAELGAEAAPDVADTETITAEPAEAATGAGEEALAEMAAALEAERGANARLVERVKAIKDKQETTVGALERRVAKLTRDLEIASAGAQGLRRANVQLRDTNRALREAVEARLDDPQLVNRSMLAELEALRAAREAEAAEMDQVLAALEPLIAGDAHA